jgi:hypothetical protein
VLRDDITPPVPLFAASAFPQNGFPAVSSRGAPMRDSLGHPSRSVYLRLADPSIASVLAPASP